MVDPEKLAALGRKFPSIADLEARAERRLPKFAFDYMSGGAGDETGLVANRDAYDAIRFTPSYLEPRRDVAVTSECLGQTYDQPFGVAPIGLSGLMWPGAAEYLAAAAKGANIPYALSTFASTDIETIGKIAGANAWFQLYPIRDDNVQFDLLDRAKEAGFSTLLVTVDTPGGRRTLRDMRNGLTIPQAHTHQFNEHRQVSGMGVFDARQGDSEVRIIAPLFW
jgi:L-lactate dehydrogenase (cytochrome)